MNSILSAAAPAAQADSRTAALDTFELDADDLDDNRAAQEDATIGDIHESIETNLWLAEGYFKRRADGLGRECLRAAVKACREFEDLLRIYSGAQLADAVFSLASKYCVEVSECCSAPFVDGTRFREGASRYRPAPSDDPFAVEVGTCSRCRKTSEVFQFPLSSATREFLRGMVVAA